MGFIGQELALHQQYSKFERLYIRFLGAPIVGLRIRARNVLALLDDQKEYVNILDIGSGTGVFTLALARRFPRARVTGIDILRSEVEKAREMAAAAGFKRVFFKKWDIAQKPLVTDSDLAVCVDILEHVRDDRAALENIHQSLGPEGALILHVPALYRRYPVFRKSLNFFVPSHVRTGYLLKDIRQKVTGAGFLIEDSGYTYGFLETLANNISYMITGAQMKNKEMYALAFPFLNLLSKIGAKARPKTLGAGIYVVAKKIEQ